MYGLPYVVFGMSQALCGMPYAVYTTHQMGSSEVKYQALFNLISFGSRQSRSVST